MHRSLACLLFATITAALACSSGDAPQLSALAQDGKQTYQAVCIACHNGNPNLDGALGPAVAGSSETLLTARVLNGEYPPGYTPKSPGNQGMPVFPYLEDKIPALAAYLAEVEAREGTATGS